VIHTDTHFHDKSKQIKKQMRIKTKKNNEKIERGYIQKYMTKENKDVKKSQNK
jgi:hypothetical protein